MPGYETHTGQFGLVSGIRQPVSDLVTIVEPGSLFAPEARKGRLYIVAEADNDASKSIEACQLVARTIRKVFYDDTSFSVTSALRAAIRAANQALYQQNFNVASQQRVYVGVTCAVIKGSDLFIAQVAPTQAYVLTEGKLRALPAHPSWDPAHVSVAPFMQTGAVGASLFIEPELYRCPLQASDTLALCSSNMARLLSRENVEHMLRFQDPAAAADNLYTLCRGHELPEAHALIVELLPPLSAAARSAPLSPAGVGERSKLVLRSVGGWMARLTGEAALAMRSKGKAEARKDEPAKPDPLTTLPEEPGLSPNPPPKLRPLTIGDDLAVRHEREQEERQQRASRRRISDMPPSTFMGEANFQEVDTPTGPRIDLSDTPALAASARPYRSRYELRPLIDLTWRERLALPFQRIGIAISDLRRTRPRQGRPRSMPTVRGQGLSYRRQRPAFPWVLLLILSLLVALLILYGTNLAQRSAQQRALDYLDQADQRMAAVRDAPDDSAALERLDVARQAIEEIRASPQITTTNAALWLRYQELQREYERALAAVQRLTFFDEVQVITTHPLPNGRFNSVTVPLVTGTVTDTAALEAQRYMYALDANKDSARLYRIPRDGGEAEAYLSPDQTVQSTVVGPLLALSWRVDNIIAVDRAASGFGYYFRSGDAWNYTRLGGSEVWSPRGRLDLETYQGNLYVWGGEPQEILKYTSGRYGDSPQLWIDPNGLDGRDLSVSIDMAVDGNIYLLQPDGHILVFTAGRLVREIVPENITPPITAVTRFFVTGLEGSGWIFLLDTLNERVIQMEKGSGKVVQQIKVRPEGASRLDQLTDIFVDDSKGRTMIYLVNGGQILRVALPDAPRPFRQPSQGPTAVPTAAP